MGRARELGQALHRYGLGMPGAYEDHPWGELVLKAGGKVFVFLGRPEETLGFSVKLPRSGVRLLDEDWAEPTHYGLGKSGWVTVTVDERCPLGERELCALIEESYRAVAPKKLVKELAGADETPPEKRAKPARARPKRKA